MDERGQASVELLAALPAIVLAALLCLQLLATGYSLTLADGAAEAGAIALASDLPAPTAVEAALPGWARDRLDARRRRAAGVDRAPAPALAARAARAGAGGQLERRGSGGRGQSMSVR